MNTAIVTIGLSGKDVVPVSGIKAISRKGDEEIVFPVFTYRGTKKSLRKQVREIVDRIFSEFEEAK